jgi:hypothetical protein
MKATDPADEAAALASLREHEQRLDRQLREARVAAQGLLAEGHLAADRLKEQAEIELRETLGSLRQEQARELELALGAIRDETLRRGQRLRHQAGLSRKRTLAWLLARVAGSDAP